MTWDAPAEVSTAHNEAGRGCELSELVLYRGHMLTFDDRTGIMFEVANFASSGPAPEGSVASRPGVRGGAGKPPRLVPRQILMEGDGETDKGMKVEWATVRDETLWVGSFGKEYTDSAGNIAHSNNLWVKAISPAGDAASVNWKPNYDAMRRALGYEHPSYLLHEAVTWSPHRHQWFILPRRVSHEAYEEVADERKGSNVIIQASPDFSTVVHTTVGVRAGGTRAAGSGPARAPLPASPPFAPHARAPPPRPAPSRRRPRRRCAASRASSSSPEAATRSSSL
jgi:soluble calcium-activated nucleotidase 1